MHHHPWNQERAANLSILTVSQNLVCFPVLRHIEPQAPLLGGDHVDILQNWDSIDCSRIDHLTLYGVQAMEEVKNLQRQRTRTRSMRTCTRALVTLS